MFVEFVDVVVFAVLFPCCSYLFKVVGLRPSLWRKRGRTYCRGREGYGALSLHDEDEDDSYGEGGDGAAVLQMRSLGSSGVGDDSEQGMLVGGPPVLSQQDAQKAARQREQALKRQSQQAEKRRKRQERRQKSNGIWMKAMADYTKNKQEKHNATLKLMDAYHPGLKARAAAAAAAGDESGSDDGAGRH